MNIIQRFMTNNPCYSIGKKISVKGLMLHSVGCPQPSAKVFINTMNKSSYSRACVHGFIDANTGDIYQTLPWNHRGWHGGGSSNNTHIGIEMCEPSCIKYTSGSSFICSDIAKAQDYVKRTYNAAVELFAFLCKKYNLDPLEDGVIVSHREGYLRGIASNHGDPEHLWNGLGMGFTMDKFRKDVYSKMNNELVEEREDEMTIEEKREFELLKNQVSMLMENQRIIYHYGVDVPLWARDALWKAQQKGIFKGASEADLNVSEDTLKTLVYMDRLNLLD